MKYSPLSASLLCFLVCVNFALGQSPAGPGRRAPSERGELFAVYVGADDCGPCHDAELKRALRKMRPVLAGRAEREGRAFFMTGVALDSEAGKGVRFLSRLGNFDEIIAGRGWKNHAAIEYLWGDTSAELGIPQLIIVEREMKNVEGRLVPSGSKIMARYVGPKTIARWVERGAPTRPK